MRCDPIKALALLQLCPFGPYGASGTEAEIFKPHGFATLSTSLGTMAATFEWRSADNRDAKARDDKHYPRPIRSNHANMKAYLLPFARLWMSSPSMIGNLRHRRNDYSRQNAAAMRRADLFASLLL